MRLEICQQIAVTNGEWESIGGGGQDLSTKQDQSGSTSVGSGEEEESNSAKLWRVFCGVAVVVLREIFFPSHSRRRLLRRRLFSLSEAAFEILREKRGKDDERY